MPAGTPALLNHGLSEKGIHSNMKTPILTIYRRRLPHWRMDDSVYFVTWRLVSSQSVLEPDERTLVTNAIRFFAGERYDLLAYVVMDDHVHVLIAPAHEFPLQQIVQTWKSFTANRLQRDFGRLGKIWEREYFDRIVRDKAELMQKIAYVVGNPTRRWPEVEDYPWAGCGLTLGGDSSDE
jgi:putative transposase